MSSLLFSDPILTSDLPDALRVIYSTELEFVARPRLYYDQLVESKDDFRARRGEQVYWTLYRQLPPSIGALSENTDVDGGQLADFQVSFTVNEYGYSIGTTEKLDLLSYQGPIANIVRQILAPQMALTQDVLARNAFITGGTYRSFAGTATSRSGIAPGDTLTDLMIRQGAHNLSVRRVPLQGNGYVAIIHPAVTFDIRQLSLWKDAQMYAGAVNLFNGEVGSLHGVRFVECDTARLPNAGATIATTTLNGAVSAGAQTIAVASASGFAAGMEITICSDSQSVPDGTGVFEEPVVIQSISGNNLTLKTKLLMNHNSGVNVVEGVDIYPISFVGGLPAVGKGVVVEPEVRVALPVDRLRRIHFVGWYGLFGYGVLRDWALDAWEVAASAPSAPAFPF